MRSGAAGRRPAPALFLIASGLVAGCRPPAPAEWVEPSTGMRFMLIPAGQFQMGSPPGEPGHESQEVLHDVRITAPFYLGKFEVTQQQWQQVMGDQPSWFSQCGADCPVERVDWHRAREFLTRLSALAGHDFRLPTEAEWEYACRAGTVSPFSSGASLPATIANYDGRYPYPGSAPGVYRGSPVPVGSFPANAWGLHDLHGNVWEWTADAHCPYPGSATADPRGECDSELKVIRGGSWAFNADSARCALRYTHRPADSGFSLGFRVARGAGGGAAGGAS